MILAVVSLSAELRGTWAPTWSSWEGCIFPVGIRGPGIQQGADAMRQHVILPQGELQEFPPTP